MPETSFDNVLLPIVVIILAIGGGLLAAWKRQKDASGGQPTNLGEVIQNLRLNDFLQPAIALAGQHPQLLKLVGGAKSLTDLRELARCLAELIEVMEKTQPQVPLASVPQPTPVVPEEPKKG